ncbi:MAG: carbohydrate ABC transporter permease [Spirochaetaceae bacterium]|nr:carbohydrate ABC transporter permease [Spirochaetaceae bacterium]
MSIKIANKKNLSKYILILLLSLYAFIQVYPFLWLVLFSLKSNSEIFGGNIAGLPEKFLWINYKDAFFGGKVGLYLFNSAFVTSLTIAITLFVSCLAAYAIARLRWKLSKTAMVFFLLGMMIPIHATLLPLFITFKDVKLLSTYWCLILPYVGFGIPIAMYIMVGFMQAIPKEMEESAFMDGAGVFSSFFRIILPIVKPAMATVAIFTFLSAWNELMFAITFISKSQFRTLTVGLQSMVGQYNTKWGPIGAGLVIGTIPTIIIYSIMSKQIQHSLVAAGAVKG